MKKIAYILIGLYTLATTSCKSGSDSNNSLTINLEPKSNSTVQGIATFIEKNGKVLMTTKLTGLKPGVHAIHLHEKADCSSADATSSGGHWNPTFKKHGKWGDAEHHKGGIGNFTADFVRVKDRDDLDACVAVLEPEDVRSQFDAAFKKFGKSLDMLLPDPRALPYVSDARWLGKIRQAAAAKYRDAKIDISDCGAKVRKLIEDAITAEGIQILVKQVSLFTPEFEEKLKALKSPEARASEMEHAIKDEIHVKLDDNPVFYTSLRERLEQLIEDRKAQRIDAAQVATILTRAGPEVLSMRGRLISFLNGLVF